MEIHVNALGLLCQRELTFYINHKKMYLFTEFTDFANTFSLEKPLTDRFIKQFIFESYKHDHVSQDTTSRKA